ncbi:putative ubiquitin-conjugating enzyme E2, ubiquitin-conjugating enzyme/RWD [Helianthus debilis subsp. tardiflorus]
MLLPQKPCLDDRGSSSFLEFYRRYKSRFDKFMESYSRVGKYPKKDVLPAQNCPTARLDAEDVLNRCRNFKRFDIIIETEAWAVMMREEWRILEENLPEMIFVRAYKSRMDLLRAVIVGAKGTPYHNGLFFFDVYFSTHLVRYHSGGLGINLHLFECGEVRLNLCRSPTDKSWTPWSSSNTNMLQFLVSIQEQVLNAHPLHHQPGFGPSVVAAYFSSLYKEAIQLKSFETMTYIMNNPPRNFEAFVVGHFRNYVVDILMLRMLIGRACKSEMIWVGRRAISYGLMLIYA